MSRLIALVMACTEVLAKIYQGCQINGSLNRVEVGSKELLQQATILADLSIAIEVGLRKLVASEQDMPYQATGIDLNHNEELV